MPGDFTHDVFLSHHSSDKPRVRALAKRLRAEGLAVWLDEDGIRTGALIAAEVDEALERSRVMILCFTPRTLFSPWVRMEWSTAICRDPDNALGRFFSVWLEDSDLPPSVKRSKYVDYRAESDAAFAEVLAACRHIPPPDSPDWSSASPTFRRTALPRGERTLDRGEYKRDLATFRRLLESDLDWIDHETDWEDGKFVNLQAKVEVTTPGGWWGPRKRRVGDLLAALRGNRTRRFFLVLGDPGSGKSVSLRRLTRELLEETPRSLRVPVYVNLRDWRTPPGWSRYAEDKKGSAAPTPAEVGDALEAWIRENLGRRLGSRGSEFLNRRFDAMMREGRFFFLLDSFDEIGLLLEVEETHALVAAFSGGIARFLHGQNGGRGLLASRDFRKPTAEFNAPCQLEIRPLTPGRLGEFARRRDAPEGFCERLELEQPGLAAAARNPFTAALLMDYMKEETADGKAWERIPLPENRGLLFERFLLKRAAACLKDLGRPDVEPGLLVGALSEIAGRMYDRAGSFELDRALLPGTLAGLDREETLPALAGARVLRLGTEGGRRVSFTHRRFAEYMIARRWMDRGDGEGEELPLEDIPRDSLWRDTLVLYCECAETKAARRVAEFCVAELRDDLAKQRAEMEASRRPVHILRFFTEAFRGRRESLLDWEEDLYGMVRKILDGGDALLIKWSLEMAGLLRDEHYSDVVSKAIVFKEPWLLDTVFRQTNRIGALPSGVLESLKVYIAILPYPRIWREYRDLHFVTRLHPGLKPLRRYLTLSFLHSFAWPIVCVLTCVLFLISMVHWVLYFTFLICGCFYSIRLTHYREYVNKLPVRLYDGLVSVSIIAGAMPAILLVSTGWGYPYAGMMIMLMFLTAMPLPEMVWWVAGPYGGGIKSEVKRIVNECVDGFAETVRVFVVVIVVCAIFAVFMIFVDKYLYSLKEWVMSLMRVGIAVFFSIVVVGLTVGFVGWLIDCMKDAGRLVRWWGWRRKQFPVNRRKISETWRSMKTSWAKLLLVNSLEKLRSVTGEWDGPAPYVSTSSTPEGGTPFPVKPPGPAEFRLARLDERWRGLA